MSTLPTIRDRRSLVQEWIRRFVAYTDSITWFGPTSVMRAWAEATAGLVEGAYLLYVALLKRVTLMASSGDALTQVATERGTPRLAEQAAKLLVIFAPETAKVSLITLGPPDILDVDDASPFSVGDTIRVRNGDGTVTEIVTIGGIAGNSITLTGALVNAYNPAVDDVAILVRVLVPANTQIATSTGVVFETLDDLYTSDANPVLDGESTFVGLADKAWCECTTKGAAGNIEPLAVTDLVTPIAGVKAVSNPEAGTGGGDTESDFDLKYRTMHRPTVANQETHAWIETLAKEGNADVLRALKVTSTTVGTMAAKVLNRNGGTFSAAELTALEAYFEQRVRSYMLVSLDNVTLTAVEVEAVITLDPDYDLATVGKAAAAALAAFLDYRKWEFGTDVDEADLLTIVNTTAGVATLETASFLPAAQVSVDDDSLPVLVRLSLQDADTGDTWNADLAVSF